MSQRPTLSMWIFSATIILASVTMFGMISWAMWHGVWNSPDLIDDGRGPDQSVMQWVAAIAAGVATVATVITFVFVYFTMHYTKLTLIETKRANALNAEISQNMRDDQLRIAEVQIRPFADVVEAKIVSIGKAKLSNAQGAPYCDEGDGSSNQTYTKDNYLNGDQASIDFDAEVTIANLGNTAAQNFKMVWLAGKEDEIKDLTNDKIVEMLEKGWPEHENFFSKLRKRITYGRSVDAALSANKNIKIGMRVPIVVSPGREPQRQDVLNAIWTTESLKTRRFDFKLVIAFSYDSFLGEHYTDVRQFDVKSTSRRLSLWDSHNPSMMRVESSLSMKSSTDNTTTVSEDPSI